MRLIRDGTFVQHDFLDVEQNFIRTEPSRDEHKLTLCKKDLQTVNIYKEWKAAPLN